jgi:hypothetical protein
MPLRLRITGETLRITGETGDVAPLAPPPSSEALLANEAGEQIVTDAGEGILVEPDHAE